MKAGFATVIVAMVLAGCGQGSEPGEAGQAASQGSAAQQALDEIVTAMGGAARIRSAGVVTVRGVADHSGIASGRTPDAEPFVWRASDYRRSMEPAAGRMRIQQTLEAQFPFALATTRRQDYGVDGAVAYNLRPTGLGGGPAEPTRASAEDARDRRAEFLHHPLVAVFMAMQDGARLSGPTMGSGEGELRVVTPQGDEYTIVYDPGTHLPAAVSSPYYDVNIGDVERVTRFQDYQDAGGLKLPMHLSTRTGRWPTLDLTVSGYAFDSSVDTAAPAAVAAAPVPESPPVRVDVEDVAEGIWRLSGNTNHRSIVFEFADHLLLFEVPLSEARAMAVIEAARKLVPGKPLTEVVVSHHHLDHAGGLRAAVAEGLTIITHPDNVAFFQELVDGDHSSHPDALARHPQQLKVRTVEDSAVLADDSMEVQLYHVKDNPHAGSLLFAYVPRGKILVQADLYDSGWLQHPWGANFIENLRMRGLDVERHVPVHGDMQTHQEVLDTLRAKGVAF